jgi:uncharacterized protein
MNYAESVRHFGKMLKNVDQWLETAKGYAVEKKFEVDVLAAARLAPDAYELARQVQAACDQAKYAGAYLGGKQPPSHPDTEKTIAELRTRIATCRAYLKSITASQYGSARERRVAPPWLNGKWMRGDQYMVQVAVPNFYFHVVTVYAILRHNGVELGKMDYVGGLPLGDG